MLLYCGCKRIIENVMEWKKDTERQGFEKGDSEDRGLEKYKETSN